jgi:hypothetical protein
MFPEEMVSMLVPLLFFYFFLAVGGVIFSL